MRRSGLNGGYGNFIEGPLITIKTGIGCWSTVTVDNLPVAYLQTFPSMQLSRSLEDFIRRLCPPVVPGLSGVDVRVGITDKYRQQAKAPRLRFFTIKAIYGGHLQIPDVDALGTHDFAEATLSTGSYATYIKTGHHPNLPRELDFNPFPKSFRKTGKAVHFHGTVSYMVDLVLCALTTCEYNHEFVGVLQELTRHRMRLGVADAIREAMEKSEFNNPFAELRRRYVVQILNKVTATPVSNDIVEI